MKNGLFFALRAVFAKINPQLFTDISTTLERLLTDVSGSFGDNKLVFVPEPRVLITRGFVLVAMAMLCSLIQL